MWQVRDRPLRNKTSDAEMRKAWCESSTWGWMMRISQNKALWSVMSVWIVRPRCLSLWGSALWGPEDRWRWTEPWWSKPERSPDRSSCTGLSWRWTAPTHTHTHTGCQGDAQTHGVVYLWAESSLTVPAVSRISSIHCCPSTSTCWRHKQNKGLNIRLFLLFFTYSTDKSWFTSFTISLCTHIITWNQLILTYTPNFLEIFVKTFYYH